MSHWLEAHQSELYAVQFRLERLLDTLCGPRDSKIARSSSSFSSSQTPHTQRLQVRMLGTLLRSAQALIAQVEAGTNSVRNYSQPSHASDLEDYYRMRLGDTYKNLKLDVQKAASWLQSELDKANSPLPVSCVGRSAVILTNTVVSVDAVGGGAPSPRPTPQCCVVLDDAGERMPLAENETVSGLYSRIAHIQWVKGCKSLQSLDLCGCRRIVDLLHVASLPRLAQLGVERTTFKLEAVLLSNPFLGVSLYPSLPHN